MPNAHERSEYLDGRFCSRFDGKKSFSKKSEHQKWLDKYDSLVSRAQNQDFIKHNLEKYGCLPIWVAVEILDFGALSHLYSGLKYKDKQHIAKKYDTSPELFGDWLNSLNFVRNIVAHHDRLWNANIVRRTDFQKSFNNDKLIGHKPFAYFYLMTHLLTVISPNSSWKTRLITHIKTFPTPSNQAIKIDDFGYLSEFYAHDW